MGHRYIIFWAGSGDKRLWGLWGCLATSIGLSDRRIKQLQRTLRYARAAPTCMCLVWNMAGVVAMKYDSMAAVLVVSTRWYHIAVLSILLVHGHHRDIVQHHHSRAHA